MFDIDSTTTQWNEEEDDKTLWLNGSQRLKYFPDKPELQSQPMSKRKLSLWQKILHLLH
jgi:hypothetical protein